MIKNKNLRFFLTAVVLLIGGYYIQQTSQNTNFFDGYIDEVRADAIVTGSLTGS